MMFGREKRRYVLYITAHDLLAVSATPNPSDDRVVHFPLPTKDGKETSVETDPNGSVQARFESWVTERRHAQFDLLIDSVDEVLQSEEVPSLNWRDRKILLKRRLAQNFRDSEFTTVRLFTVRNDRKKSRHAQMSALRGSVTLAPWLDILLAQHVQIRAVTSPTLLSTRVALRLGEKKHGLFVSMNPSGLRQTLTCNGRVAFSRLATLANATPVDIVSEVTRTIQYLLMSQQITRDLIRDGSFRVWIVVDNDDTKNKFPGTVSIDQGTEAPITLVDALLHDRAQFAGHSGLAFWTSALEHSTTKDYRTPRVTRFFRLALLRNRIQIASAAMVMIGALALLGVTPIIEQYRQLADAQTESRRSYDQEQMLLNARLGEYPSSAAQMQAIVEVSKVRLSRNINPATILGAIARAVPATAGLRITQIAWSSADNAQLAMINGTAPSFADEDQIPDIKRRIGTILSVAGTIDPKWTKGYANSVVLAMTERLKAECACITQQLQLPYDPTPSISLSQEYDRQSIKARQFRIQLQTGNFSSTGLNGPPTALARELHESTTNQVLR